MGKPYDIRSFIFTVLLYGLFYQLTYVTWNRPQDEESGHIPKRKRGLSRSTISRRVLPSGFHLYQRPFSTLHTS